MIGNDYYPPFQYGVNPLWNYIDIPKSSFYEELESNIEEGDDNSKFIVEEDEDNKIFLLPLPGVAKEDIKIILYNKNIKIVLAAFESALDGKLGLKKEYNLNTNLIAEEFDENVSYMDGLLSLSFKKQKPKNIKIK
jgi:HSP20 family molecular chaperone IbpA